MPVLVVEGRQYRVPLTTLLKGNKGISEQLLAAKRENDTLKPKVTLEQATATRTSGTGNDPNNQKCDNHKPAGWSDRVWSVREDRVLRDLIAFRVPWSRISIALGNKPMDDVKERWEYIRKRKTNNVELVVDGAVSTGGNRFGSRRSKKSAKTVQAETKPERHVSFSDPLVTAGDTTDEDDENEGSSRPPKIKKVYYIDEEFSLEDVVMLHNIAAKWERDRWLAISTRFNDTTGRKITPEQAKSMFDN